MTLGQMNLQQLAESATAAFFQVGGTWEMVEGQPCRTEGQAVYLGQMQAYNRVMFNMGLEPSSRVSVMEYGACARADRAYADYL